jgi:hypothetical protein
MVLSTPITSFDPVRETRYRLVHVSHELIATMSDLPGEFHRQLVSLDASDRTSGLISRAVALTEEKLLQQTSGPRIDLPWKMYTGAKKWKLR